MDESSLVSVLAKKYSIDIEEPKDLMKLYNRLCIAVENELLIKQVSEDYNEQIYHLDCDISKKTQILIMLTDTLKDSLNSLPELHRSKLISAARKNGLILGKDGSIRLIKAIKQDTEKPAGYKPFKLYTQE